MTTTGAVDVVPSAVSDAIDSQARDVALAWRRGDLADDDARWILAALVRPSPVPREVIVSLTHRAVSFSDGIDQSIDELVDALVALIGPGGAKIDLGRIADGASFSGWLRRFGTTVATTTVRRDMTRHRYRHPPVTDGMADVTASPGAVSVRRTLLLDSVADELAVAHRRAATPGELMHAQEAAYRTIAGLPALRRPDTAQARAAVRRAIDEPGHIKALVAAIGRRTALPDSPVLDLFEDCRLDELAGTPAAAITLMARAAIAPRGLPRRGRVREVLQWADRQHKPNPRPAHVRLLRAALRAWLTVRADLDEETGRHKSDTRIADDRRAWRAAANACLDAGVVVAGATIDQMADRFEEALAGVEQASARTAVQSSDSAARRHRPS